MCSIIKTQEVSSNCSFTIWSGSWTLQGRFVRTPRKPHTQPSLDTGLEIKNNQNALRARRKNYFGDSFFCDFVLLVVDLFENLNQWITLTVLERVLCLLRAHLELLMSSRMGTDLIFIKNSFLRKF